MCGIAGQAHRRGIVECEALSLLETALTHRGPDDRGEWYSPDRRVGLLHRRLAILDLSERARQPMSSPCGRFTVVFNGEIYNFRALRVAMEAKGEKFATQGDTEVLLRLWTRLGANCLLDLRGMFSFAMWDSAERTLTLARDPMGIKPLYWTESSAGAMTFASEVKALRAVGLATELNVSGLATFLRWGSTAAPDTVYRNVRALQPGSVMVWHQDDGAKVESPYWDYASAWKRSHELIGGIRSVHEAVEWTEAALLDSVSAHLVSDVPVGAFLSGGVDSTAVVALMRRAGQDKVETFSIASENPRLDEAGAARRIARHYECLHHEMVVGKSDVDTLVRGFFASLDQPTIDGLNTYVVSSFASGHGMKVVTSGIGGDELFRGYRRSFAHLPVLLGVLSRTPSAVRRATAKALRVSAPRFGERALRLSTLLESDGTLPAIHRWSRQVLRPEEVAQLFRDGSSCVHSGEPTGHAVPPSKQASIQAAISALESERYLGAQLLPDSDAFSMRHGLELRTPLVDRVLHEHVVALPDDLFRGPSGVTKPLLVGASQIPAALVQPKKMGFTLDIGSWLPSIPSPQFDDEVVDTKVAERIYRQAQLKERHWSHGWAMLVLAHVVNRA